MTELEISGMSCANCARHVAEALRSVAGVRSAEVNLEGQRGFVRWAEEVAQNPEALIQAVARAGYGAKLAKADAQTPGPGKKKPGHWQANLWAGLCCTFLLMAGEWLFGWGLESWFRWLSFALAGVVQTVAGARFYQGAWRQLKAGHSNMDTLVALGSSTAFGYSAWALLSGAGGHLYFMEAAAIISLISLGHWLEARVSERAASALHKLMSLAPALARRRNADGSDTEVPLSDLRIGDLVSLRPGDRVPTDGEVTAGQSSAEEAMLTGESAPVEKSAKSPLYAGTIVLNGQLLMRVTATGEATALAQIVQAVERAQNSRAEIQRLADRVSSVFVPVVVVFALAAGLFWGLAPDSAGQLHEWMGRFLWTTHPPAGPLAAAFIIASAVLIVACPCAMGLATPAAIMAASNAAAQRGILIRDSIALEKAGVISTVLFDKTGTLTLGKPIVVGWTPICAAPLTAALSPSDGQKGLGSHQTSERRLLPLPLRGGEGRGEGAALMELAAALARRSSHPLSKALAAMTDVAVSIDRWQEVRGAGVEAEVSSFEFRVSSLVSRVQSCESNFPTSAMVKEAPKSKIQNLKSKIRLGSLSWLAESGVDLAEGIGFVSQWTSQGASVVGLSVENELCGLFAVQDALKAGAGQVVELLARQGLGIYMVTGDKARTANSIAKQAGIPEQNIFAEVRPEQKAEVIRRLQAQGLRVAFVGDGINDAPALQQADLGIAVSRATDIAREAADILLLRSDIQAMPESLQLAAATLRTIKQNLFWAFAYNALAVPLAAVGFLSPILCAGAMGLSDLVVIGNALRLLRWGKKERVGRGIN